jgi:hypothetical protein
VTEAEFWARGQGASGQATLTEDDFWSRGGDPSDPMAFGEIPQEELAQEPSGIEQAFAFHEKRRQELGLDPYQYNLQLSAERGLEADPRGAITGSVPYRAAESAAESFVNRTGSLGAGLTSSALDLIGADDAADSIDQIRASAQGRMDAANVQQAMLDKRGLLGETLTSAFRGGGAAVGESVLSAASFGGLGGLAAYFGATKYDETLADGGSQSEAFTHGAIEGAFTFLGGKLIGAGTGKLAEKIGGGAASETIGSRAAEYIAKKFPIPKWAASATTGAAGEVAEEAATEVSHYLADVGFGRERWSKDKLLERVLGVVGPSAVAGLLGGGLANTIESLDRRYKAVEGVKTLVEKTATNQPVSRGDLERAGIGIKGPSNAESRKEIAREFVEQQNEAPPQSEAVDETQRPDGGVVQGQAVSSGPRADVEPVVEGEVSGPTGDARLPRQRPQEIREAPYREVAEQGIVTPPAQPQAPPTPPTAEPPSSTPGPQPQAQATPATAPAQPQKPLSLKEKHLQKRLASEQEWIDKGYEGRRPKPGDNFPDRGRVFLDDAHSRAPMELAGDVQAVADWIRRGFPDSHYWRYLKDSGQTLEQALGATTPPPPAVEPAVSPVSVSDESTQPAVQGTQPKPEPPESDRSRPLNDAERAIKQQADDQYDIDQKAAQSVEDLNRAWQRREDTLNAASIYPSLYGYRVSKKPPTLPSTTPPTPEPPHVQEQQQTQEAAQEAQAPATQAEQEGGGVLDWIEREAKSIADGIAAQKQRSMRYQPDLKEKVAAELGVPVESVDLPYKQWDQIRTAYNNGDLDEARRLTASAPQGTQETEASEGGVPPPKKGLRKKPAVPKKTRKLGKKQPAQVERAVSPVMQSYNAAKQEAGDAILLYRTGDFYEMFGDDAKTGAAKLGLAKTVRERDGEELAMSGFPYHHLDTYVNKLVRSGHRVAVREPDGKLTLHGEAPPQQTLSAMPEDFDERVLPGQQGLFSSTAQFSERVRKAASSPEEADANLALWQAVADYRGETLDEFASKAVADIERTPVSQSRYLKKHGEKQPPGTILPSGDTLTQQEGRTVRGETQFLDDGRAIIRLFEEGSNLATLAHESSHVFRRWLKPEDTAIIENALAVKDGKWSRGNEERFARWFERYLRDGKAPNKKLASVFEKFREWLTAIYRNLSNSPLAKEVPTEVRAVFDKLLGTTAESAAVSKSAPAPEVLSQAPGTEERKFAGRFAADERIAQEIRDSISEDARFYEPLPNAVTAESAKKLVDERGVAESMKIVRDESNDLPYHVRSALGQIVIQKLNQTYRNLRDANSDSTDFVLAQAVEMAEWQMEFGTRLGRGVQAFAMWSRLTPEGKLRTYKRAVDKARDKHKKESGKEVQEIIDEVNAAENPSEDTETKDVLEKAVRKSSQRAATKRPGKPAKQDDKSVWQQYKDSIARQLADIAAGEEKQQPPPLREFSDRLLRGVKPLIKTTPDADKLDPYSLMREVVTNFDKYQEAWNESVAFIRKKYGEKPAVLADIEKRLGNLNTAFRTGQFDKVFKDAVKQAQINFNELARAHVRDSSRPRTQLFEDIRTKMGIDISAEDAQVLVDRFNARIEKSKQDILKALAKKGNKTAKRVRTLSSKIVEAARLGALNEQTFYDAVSERLGLPNYSPQVAREILNRAEDIDAVPDGIPRDKKVLELNRYIAQQKGFEAGDLPLGVYYGNILSGYNTHIVNGLDTALNVLGEINGLAMQHPRAAAKIYGGMLRGLSGGRHDMLEALTRGRMATENKWLESPRIMDAAEFGKKGGVPIAAKSRAGRALKAAAESKVALPLNAWKYVTRALAATDALMYRTAKEARASLLAHRMATGEGLTGDALETRVREILSLNRQDEFSEQAEREGFTGNEAKARALELMDMARPADLSSDIADFAGEATYNHKPHGAIGYISEKIGEMSDRYKALKLFVPFTRIVANVTNRGLNWTPYGYKRAMWGYSGEGPLTQEQRSQMLMRATMGTGGLVLMGALHAAGVVVVHGAGPSDEEKRRQLMNAGWRPYSLQIGDHYFVYSNTPVGLGLSILGNYLDSNRYREMAQKDALTRVAYSVARVGSTIFSQSFLSGLSRLFDALSTNPNESVNAVKQTLSGTVSGVTTPSLVRDATRLFDNKLYEANTLLEDLIKQTPFAALALKPTLNAFGEPVRLYRQRWLGNLSSDPVWRFVVEKGLRVPVASRSTKMQDDVRITPQEYHELVRETGQKVKTWLQDNMDRISSLSDEEAQEELSDAAASIRKDYLWLKRATPAEKTKRRATLRETAYPEEPKYTKEAIAQRKNAKKKLSELGL